MSPDPTAASSCRCADQVDRLFAVGIGDLRVGSLLEEITNEIRPARLCGNVKSRHTFVHGGRASVAHRIRLRASDLSIHVRAVFKQQIQERHIRATAGSSASSASDPRLCDQECCDTHRVDIG